MSILQAIWLACLVPDEFVVLTADSAGSYVACGVPGNTPITIHAERDSLLSDFATVQFVPEGVVQGPDLFESDAALWRQDFTVQPQDTYRAQLTGVITRTDDGSPLSGAVVRLLALDLETTSRAVQHEHESKQMPLRKSLVQVLQNCLMHRRQTENCQG